MLLTRRYNKEAGREDALKPRVVKIKDGRLFSCVSFLAVKKDERGASRCCALRCSRAAVGFLLLLHGSLVVTNRRSHCLLVVGR